MLLPISSISDLRLDEFEGTGVASSSDSRQAEGTGGGGGGGPTAKLERRCPGVGFGSDIEQRVGDEEVDKFVGGFVLALVTCIGRGGVTSVKKL